MIARPLARRCRDLLAAALIAASAGALSHHHHADHDGTLLHLEEDHGSHGETLSPDPERLPAPSHMAPPPASVESVRLPDLLDPAPRPAPEPHLVVRAAGPDPPAARGSRAPPSSPPESRRTA